MEVHVIRSLCQEARRWYMDHLDPLTSHRENVINYLRGPVLALTVRTLYPAEDECITATTEAIARHDAVEPTSSVSSITKSSKPQDWRDFLQGDPSVIDQDSSAMWSKKDQNAYDMLDRRTKARMDAFLHGCTLAIPEPATSNAKHSNPKANPKAAKPDASTTQQPLRDDVSLADGLSGFQPRNGKNGKLPSPISSPVLRSLSANGNHLLRQISAGSAMKHTQMSEEELLVRLELYLRTLNCVHMNRQECVISYETPKMLKARAKIIVRAFVITVGCVQRLSPVLTELLRSLTQEMLAVEKLGEDLVKMIRRVAMEYEHQTSFASLAFLSSPEASAENRLTPLIVSYLKYLQSNHENLICEAELERMLSQTINPKLRRIFKTIEFNSIGHLLEVCQNLRGELQNIELAPPGADGFCSEDTTQNPQALRQALRDLQREVITINGHVLPPVTSRKDLVYLLSQTLNSRALTSEPPTTTRRKHRSSQVRRAESCPTIVSLDKQGRTRVHSEESLSSENDEGDTDGSSVCSKSSCGSGLNDCKKRHRKRNFHLSTIDVLTRRLLIAASRTGLGGDAFFVVRDLFGGDEVEVVPAKQLPMQSGHHVARQGTIEIVVKLASVTIKCHGTFDVYPKSLVGNCEPLIQLHTTTTETIGLREVRAHGSTSSSDDGLHDDCGGDNRDGDNSDYDEDRGTTIMLVQERKTEHSGRRTLSIRPALYERVEVWITPS